MNLGFQLDVHTHTMGSVRRGIGRLVRAVWVLGPALALSACSQYQPFDSAADLSAKLTQAGVTIRDAPPEVPFALPPDLVKFLDDRLKPGPNEDRRVTQVTEFIFGRLNLQYALAPTRSAAGTYRAQQGNCMSFTNLFVGIARHQRLAPFYVNVTDQQKWSVRDGMVVSQGHIVAGLYVKGQLRTYDFLPYEVKAYKKFKPIDDVTAAAHYYNNLGAEALLAGDIETAGPYLTLATRIAPKFVKATNNLGVLLTRRGEVASAIEVYQKGLEIEPDDVALRTNLASLYQKQGRGVEAQALLAELDVANNTNPFYFVYQSEMALARGDSEKALELLREALRRDTEVPEVHLGFVKVFLARGDLERARYHLERALRLDATNEQARRYAVLLARPAS